MSGVPRFLLWGSNYFRVSGIILLFAFIQKSKYSYK